MKRIFQGRAGQYTWLQVLSLIIATVAFSLGSQTVAIVMLILGFVVGILGTYTRVQEAKQINSRAGRNRRVK